MILRSSTIGQALRARQRGFLLNPFRFGAGGGGGGGGFVGPLDAHTANLWCATSLAQLLTAWGGGSFSAVNTTSLATATIGFDSSGALDTAALATLASTNSVVITAFLNQFGASNQGMAASGTLRPTVVNAGSYLGHIEFDGSTDGMATGTTSGTPSAFTIFLRGKLRATTTQIILEHSSDYNSNDSAIGYYDAGALSAGSHKVSAAGYSRSDYTGMFPNDNVHCWRVDRSQVTSALQSVAFVNGVKQTRSADGSSGTLPTGNFAAKNWFLGARNQTTLFAQLNLHTLLIFESALSDSDCTAISSIVTALP